MPEWQHVSTPMNTASRFLRPAPGPPGPPWASPPRLAGCPPAEPPRPRGGSGLRHRPVLPCPAPARPAPPGPRCLRPPRGRGRGRGRPAPWGPCRLLPRASEGCPGRAVVRRVPRGCVWGLEFISSSSSSEERKAGKKKKKGGGEGGRGVKGKKKKGPKRSFRKLPRNSRLQVPGGRQERCWSLGRSGSRQRRRWRQRG